MLCVITKNRRETRQVSHRQSHSREVPSYDLSSRPERSGVEGSAVSFQILGILPAMNPGAPYLALFARCGKIRKSFLSALGNLDASLKYKRSRSVSFPHLAKDARYGAPGFVAGRIPRSSSPTPSLVPEVSLSRRVKFYRRPRAIF